MKSFVIFAIVVTIIYVIYYTVIIVQDLYGKPKDEKSQGESFDVSDMTDEEESIAVSESDGGFSVGDNQYETAYEEKQLAEPTEEAAATAEESKPHVLEKIQSAIEKKMEEVNTTYSDPMYSEELNNTLPLHGKNKWLSNSSIQKKTGPNNGTKVVSKEAIRMQQTGALLWLYAWRNEAGNPTLQLYHQKSEEHEH